MIETPRRPGLGVWGGRRRPPPIARGGCHMAEPVLLRGRARRQRYGGAAYHCQQEEADQPGNDGRRSAHAQQDVP